MGWLSDRLARAREDDRIAAQGVKYLLVGGSSAVLELVLFELLYAVAGLPVAAANVPAVLVATACNYLLHRTFTFGSTRRTGRSLVLYLVLFVANMAISTVAIAWLISLGVPSAIAKVVLQACVATWNFFIMRSVVFR